MPDAHHPGGPVGGGKAASVPVRIAGVYSAARSDAPDTPQEGGQEANPNEPPPSTGPELLSGGI